MKLHFLIRPLTYIYIYIFLMISTVHLQIPFLRPFPVEIVCFISILFFSIVEIVRSNIIYKIKNPIFIKALIFTLFIIEIPLLSSLANNDYLTVLLDGEYRSFVKIVILALLIIFFVDKNEKKGQLINVVIFSFSLLGIIFTYRYLILGEVREYDLRPLLKIRNGDPNFLGTYFSACIPLAIYSFRKAEIFTQRLYYLMAIIFFFVCTIMNQSRMGLIALAIMIVVLMVFLKWRNALGYISLCIFIIALSLMTSLGSRIVTRFVNMGDTSNLDRLKTLKSGFYTFFESPWLGVGWNNSFEYYYRFAEYPAFQSTSQPYEVHNTILKIACELGLAGTLLYLVFLFVISLSIYKNFRVNKEQAILCFAVMIVLLINSITISAGYKDLYILFMVLAFVVAPLDHPMKPLLRGVSKAAKALIKSQ